VEVQQTYKRSLKLYHLTMLGLGYLAPMIVYGIYGVIASSSNGTEAGAYLAAMLGMMFTAFSYAQMSKEFQVSGSAYTYTRKTIHPNIGFMVGWATMLDYIFIPMVVWLIATCFVQAIWPNLTQTEVVLAFIIVTTAINILGIKVGADVNLVMVGAQLVITAICIFYTIGAIVHGLGEGTLVSLSPFWNSGSSISMVFAGAAVACYSFIGFDAITTFTEEAVNPGKDIPRAIILTCFCGGIIFLIVCYFSHLAHPGTFKEEGNAAAELIAQVAPAVMLTVFNVGLIITQFCSGIATQASGARLMYAMARDGVLPKGIWAKLSTKFNTPYTCILTTAFIGLLALKLDVATSTSFVCFGAFCAFIFTNLSVISHFFIKNNRRSGMDVIYYLISPLIGAVLCTYLIYSLDKNALILGGSWATAGFLWLLYLTKGFKNAPPEMDMGH